MTTAGGNSVSTLFRSLLDIKDQLATGNPDMNWLSNTALTTLDTVSDKVLLNQTEIGARQATYEMSENLLLNNYTTIYENTSANDDIDLARVTVDFKNSENLYNAALSIGARIMPQSLVDFLR
jgi:flagellar hook-associated protein 3 FlgL